MGRFVGQLAGRTIMDIFWSIFAMPIGLVLCFGPVLVAWWQAERKRPPPGNKT